MTIIEAIQIYLENNKSIIEYNAPSTEKKSFHEWKEAMELRAKVLVGYCYDNEEILKYISEYAKNPKEEDISNIYEKLLECYRTVDFTDFEIYARLCPMLMDYYQRKNDFESMYYMLYIYNYALLEFQGRAIAQKGDLSSLYTVLSYKDRYSKFSERDKHILLSTYFQLIIVCPITFWADDLTEYFEVYKDFLAFRESLPEEEKNSDLFQSFNSMIENGVCSYLQKPGKLSTEIIQELSPLAISQYTPDESLYENGEAFDAKVNYYFTLCENGSMDRDKAVEILFEDYKIIKDKVYEELLFIPQYILADGIMTLIDSASCKEKYHSIIQYINHTIIDAIKKYTMLPIQYINQMMTAWTAQTLGFYQTIEELEDSIMNGIIKGQLSTYLHVVMVKNIALEILEVAYTEKKELFDSLDMSYDNIYDYCKRASLFHDLGKTKITDVITKQGRKLSNVEFMGIKSHPELGIQLLKWNPLLEKYRDPVLFHHKWYNGHGGYPENYDNTTSKYRIITDIITLADCLDAATDYLGRNYKNSKKLNQVLEEFKVDAGIRYNPDLVQIVLGSALLQEKLQRITEDDRARMMYDAYVTGLKIE